MDSHKIISRADRAGVRPQWWRRWAVYACLGDRNTSSIGAWLNSLDRRPPWYCTVSPLLQTNKKTKYFHFRRFFHFLILAAFLNSFIISDLFRLNSPTRPAQSHVICLLTLISELLWRSRHQRVTCCIKPVLRKIVKSSPDVFYQAHQWSPGVPSYRQHVS